jgi:hypothetical protein
VLPDDVTARDLVPAARNELKTLSKENAERVARHLAMASRLIDEDPALAHEHAQAAVRHAGRLAVARETLAITAYATGDFALALRELRTQRRLTGRNDHAALIVDSERGVGRPEKALEEGRNVDREALPVAARVELAIAISGARLDLGQTELALHELDIPELDPDRAYEWSPGLFAARANVLEDLGRTDEAASWRRRAEVAAEALGLSYDEGEDDVILVDDTETEHPLSDDGSGHGPEGGERSDESSGSDPDATETGEDSAGGDLADEDDRGEVEQQDSDVNEAVTTNDPIASTDGEGAGQGAQDADLADAEPPSDARDRTEGDSTGEATAESDDVDANGLAEHARSENDEHGFEEISLEDEVTELLIAAGIDDPEGHATQDDSDEPEQDESVSDEPAHNDAAQDVPVQDEQAHGETDESRED